MFWQTMRRVKSLHIDIGECKEGAGGRCTGTTPLRPLPLSADNRPIATRAGARAASSQSNIRLSCHCPSAPPKRDAGVTARLRSRGNPVRMSVTRSHNIFPYQKSLNARKEVFISKITSSSSLDLQPVAMTGRDKSRCTEGSVIIGGMQVLAWIRSDGSVDPAGTRATFSQKLESE
ncbi:hypothetical protein EVAR_86603_1 [Eumeta japonica]|uniref:Uncharacterized protein n=1 Tax=Eumeta variegata TaxID=151549 RepID=A0A4C1W0H4_EUMVA|nr:hypothetical protein EVAR_86603_1 [Eumeta japonica]